VEACTRGEGTRTEGGAWAVGRDRMQKGKNPPECGWREPTCILQNEMQP
jgi:hypothetical protein